MNREKTSILIIWLLTSLLALSCSKKKVSPKNTGADAAAGAGAGVADAITSKDLSAGTGPGGGQGPNSPECKAYEDAKLNLTPAKYPFATYKQSIHLFLAKNCVRCHGDIKQSAGLNLNTYETVFKNGTKIAGKVASDHKAAGGAYHPDLKKAFQDWTTEGFLLTPTGEKYLVKPPGC